MTHNFPFAENGIQSGDILVRLARSEEEIKLAQRIRYHIFYEEFHAKPTPEVLEKKRDFDHFDDFADHLIVLDTTIKDPAQAIVGTYRMMNEHKAAQAGRFYTSDEFDISRLLENHNGFLEMGRSCVLEKYRTKHVLQLLWQGIAEYVTHYQVQFLFGCASFHGTDPMEHIESLSYLYHNHMAPPEYRPIAHDDRFDTLPILPADQIDARKVLRQLPPLIKGYIRIGALIGDGIFIDHDFDTVDVCIVAATSNMPENYIKHYERTTGQTITR